MLFLRASMRFTTFSPRGRALAAMVLPFRFALMSSSFTADLLHINRSPLVGKRRCARDDEKPMKPTQRRGDLFDHAICKVLLFRIVTCSEREEPRWKVCQEAAKVCQSRPATCRHRLARSRPSGLRTAVPVGRCSSAVSHRYRRTRSWVAGSFPNVANAASNSSGLLTFSTRLSIFEGACTGLSRLQLIGPGLD
jgi:hypothetical protein